LEKKQKKAFKHNCLKTLYLHQAGERIRTADLLITNQLLYLLSYAGKRLKSLVSRVVKSGQADFRTGSNWDPGMIRLNDHPMN
jgi:hypothetical protein